MDLSTKKPTNNSKWYNRDLFKPTKLSTNVRPYFLKTVSELLSEGFSLHQSLPFLCILLPKYAHLITPLNDSLSSGMSLEQAIEPLGFSRQIVAQLFYAQRQGRLYEAMARISEQLNLLLEYRKKLITAIIYPIMMSLFLVALLFGMRQFLLPQIASFITVETYEENLLARILIIFFTYLPQITMTTLALLCLIYFLIDRYLLTQTPLQQCRILTRLPFIKKWAKQYVTYRFTQELGNFMTGGYSILQFIEILITYPIDPLLSDIARHLDQSLKAGDSVGVALEKMALFQAELPAVITQGELLSQMASKCRVYSQKIQQDLLEDIAKKINYIQPILFIMIAVLVMAMYLLMMLPMLTMEGI